MAAAGAQIICFTSGRGTPTGFPLVPVIKITGNDKTYRLLEDNIDINAGTVVTGTKKISEVGQEIYEEILAVANGKQTKAEAMGHALFYPFSCSSFRRRASVACRSSRDSCGRDMPSRRAQRDWGISCQ